MFRERESPDDLAQKQTERRGHDTPPQTQIDLFCKNALKILIKVIRDVKLHSLMKQTVIFVGIKVASIFKEKSLLRKWKLALDLKTEGAGTLKMQWILDRL